MLDNIFGVDIDSAAVEVTQLSLYLKMLEHETKTTLGKQKDLFPSDIAVLPALKDNIKCGNSLISSNFSALPEDLTRVNAFDWSVQFEAIMKDGGFDTVIGNPPWGANVLGMIRPNSPRGARSTRHFARKYWYDSKSATAG